MPFNKIIEVFPVPVFCKNCNGIFIGCNKAFAEFIGLPRSAVIGRSGFDLLPPKLAERYQIMDEELFRQGIGAVSSQELDLRNARGEMRKVLVHKATLSDEAGQVMGLLGVLFDLTELRRTERMLTTVFRACPDMVAITDKHTGEYLIVNDAYERVLGFTRGEMIGRTSLALGVWPMPEERERVIAAFGGATRLLDFESVFRRKNGEEFAMQISLEDVYLDGRDCVVSVVRDISDRKRDEAELQLAASVFHSTVEGVLITDVAGDILSVNPAFTAITGWSAKEAIGRNPRFLKSGFHEAFFYTELWRSLIEHGHWQGDIWNRRRNGEAFLVRQTITMVPAADGKPLRYVGVFSDITELKRKDERIQHLAFHDVVTGLPNRSLLMDRLDHALALSERETRNLAVLFLDLDRFKLVNDTLGHDTGDELLKVVSSRLQAIVRSTDTVSRLGGDEFVILLDNPSDETEVAHIAERIIEAVNRPLDFCGTPARVGASIGIAMHPFDGTTASQLMKNADTAMYAAKAMGRNTYRFFNPRMTESAEERLRLETDLREAVLGNGFELFYQPKICLKCLRPCGAEALIRWPHPERGMITPAAFIAVAEECGLIVRIGDWVMEKACRALAAWRRQGISNFTLAVNLSPAQLRDGGLPGRLKGMLATHRLDGAMLELELTEGAVMGDPEHAVAVLHQIRELGISLTIDDFGTGYSSLSYLKKLPLDTIKIDRSFVVEVCRDVEYAEILRTILALGRALRRTIIAEGVETAEQAAFLQAEGCHMAQGDHFAPPMPEAEFATWLAGRQASLCEGCRDQSQPSHQRSLSGPLPG